MTRLRLVLRSLVHYRRAHLAVLAGMVVGAAALAGALVVGDSIRGSLRRMTLERLGAIDFAMVAPRFFREGLAADLAGDPEFAEAFVGDVVPAAILRGSLENATTGARAGRVGVVGTDASFFDLDAAAPEELLAERARDRARAAETGEPAPLEAALSGNHCALNESLALELGVGVGDFVLLRLQRPSEVSAEAVHGRRDERVESLRLEVRAVLPDRGLARFSLYPSQQIPFNAFVPLATLQRRFEQAGKINALLVAGVSVELARAWGGGNASPRPDGEVRLAALLKKHARAMDMDLRVRVNRNPGYLSVESARMVLEDREIAAIEDAARALGLRASPTLTYLANTISKVGDDEARTEDDATTGTPYSTVSALEFGLAAPLGALKLLDGAPAPEPAPDEILLNDWLAEDLAAAPGDRIVLRYYMDGPGGRLEERVSPPLRVAGIVASEGDGAADSGLTPDYPGLSDADSMADWDPPFPVDLKRVREKDEAWWDRRRATPKAFVSLEFARAAWSSRFGSLTSMRLAPAAGGDAGGDATEDDLRALEAALRERLDPADAGLVFEPVKARGLASSQGATDFSGLFVGFSMFVIVSAFLLARLFFALMVERRAREVGLLAAVGFGPKAIRNLFLIEGAVVAIPGAALGALAGLGWAALMLHGLRTWWRGAVGTSLLFLEVRPASLVAGAMLGALAALGGVWMAVRGLSRVEPSRLFAGGAAAGSGIGARNGPDGPNGRNGLDGRSRDGGGRARTLRLRLPSARATAFGGAAFAILALAGSPFVGAGGARMILFQLAGCASFVAGLAAVALLVRDRRAGALPRPGWIGLARLGAAGAARNPGRTRLAVGLMASAGFLVVAVAANRADLSRAPIRKDSGNGGFLLYAEADPPLLRDLNDPADRDALALPAEARAALERLRVHAFRMNAGDDASCLNLYRPTRPRILGAPDSLIERGGFAFQGTLAKSEEEKANPWRLLGGEPNETTRTKEMANDDPIPAIGDFNTVMWILHSKLGGIVEIEDAAGRPARLRIVALLKGSALQGELIVSDANFLRLFPLDEGREVFLIEEAVGAPCGTPSRGAPTASASSTPPRPDDLARARALAATLESGLGPWGFDAVPTQERIDAFLVVQNTYLSTFLAIGGLGLLLGTFGLAAAMLRGVEERRAEFALLRATGFGPRAIASMVLAEGALVVALGLGVGAGAAILGNLPAILSETADVPWLGLAATLGGSAAFGLGAGLAAARAAVRAPIVAALRGE